MAKFVVYAKSVQVYKIEVEADNIEEAEMIGKETDGGDFEEVPQSQEWYVYDTREA